MPARELERTGPAARHRLRETATSPRVFRCLFVGASLAAAPMWPSVAQQVDLGALEQMFGEPVTTSATGAPQRVGDVPVDMDVITADDIRRSGADNLPDILRYVAGLDVRRYGFAAADVAVRGYNETSSPRLLVLVDGQQVYLDDPGRTQWYTLPVELSEIRQIEVIKGPNSALYGFNAASGVVNIVTYDPLHDAPINKVTFRAGTQAYTSVSAVGSARVADTVGIRIFADGFNAREFRPIGINPADLAFQRSPERRAVGMRAKFQLAPGVELSASGSLVNTRVWEATASPYFGTDYQRTNWSRVGLTADTWAGLISASIYRNELRYSYSGVSELEDLHDTLYVAQVSDLIKLGTSHTLRVGVDYRYNMATSSNVLAGKISYQVLSASLMWDWRITPQLSVTNAVRFDHFALRQRGFLQPETGLASADFNRRTIDQPSFNSGVVWGVTDTDTLRLMVGRGLQLPSVYDLGLQDRQVYPGDGLTPMSSQTFLAVGNPRLNPAVVEQQELSWEHALPDWATRIRGAVFAQRTYDVLTNPYEATPVYTNFPDGSQFALARAMNVGHSAALGAEIGVRGHSTGGFRWNASYSFMSVSDHLSINQDGFYSPQDFAHGTPSHAVILGAGYTHGNWELDVRGRWQARFLDFRVDTTQNNLTPVWIRDYVTVDARVGYTVTPNLLVSLTGQQFNASQLRQSGAPPIERRLILSVTAGL